MNKTPRKAAVGEDTESPGSEFPGDTAPPLTGEQLCICGEPDGAHLVDGTCPATGCLHFIEEHFAEEPTRPDVVVEYDPDFAPLAGGLR